MRVFEGHRLVIATHNRGKAREFAQLLEFDIKDFANAADLHLPEPEETGVTFAENAILKSKAAAKETGSMALSDDSGLCVTALNGAPGIYSARWAGANKDFNFAMSRINHELGDAEDRSAYFICVLALSWPDGYTEIFEGRVHGHIAWPPRGTGGFGYNPIFIPQGHTRTFAEMSDEEKNAISHRSIATHHLLTRLRHK